MTRQRLVHGVVDHLVDEVVQTTRTRRADVHAGTLTNRLKTFEDRDVLRVVTGIVAGARPGAIIVRHDPPMTLRHSGPALLTSAPESQEWCTQ
jgi:uncharacterized NAD-dependent epimerase/dehydratase family protein